jgi:hypothetical protein
MTSTARSNYPAILKKIWLPILELLPFFHQIFKILILFVLYFKNYKRYMLTLNCKRVRHVKVYIPCNFEVNLITHLGVIALFSSNFLNFNTFRLIFQKLYEIKVKFKLQKCAACQDLPTPQFVSKSHYPFWSYCPFFIKCFKF